MDITLIDGGLYDYTASVDEGHITIYESDLDTALAIVKTFLDYGKTVVIEPDGVGK